ncbi:MAG TPA: DUF192 domain-containing protein [Chloroflexota bacterium]|nr:DUF192 domain-containing protein [Chloroflexota bacterium]
MIENRTRNAQLAQSAEVARGPIRRGLGLMGRRGWSGSDGLVLERCGSIHTLFMRMPIDVVYLDRDGTVLRADQAMPPWRIGPIVRRARTVLELPAGTIVRTATQPGDSVALDPSG